MSLYAHLLRCYIHLVTLKDFIPLHDMGVGVTRVIIGWNEIGYTPSVNYFMANP